MTTTKPKSTTISVQKKKSTSKNNPTTFTDRVKHFWETDTSDDVVKELLKKGIDLGYEAGKQALAAIKSIVIKKWPKKENAGAKDSSTEIPVNPVYADPISTDEFLRSDKSSSYEWIIPKLAAKDQISCLVAQADVGKSIAALSVGIPLSNGWPIPFAPQATGPVLKMNVIYYALEPRPKEFGERIKRPVPNISWVPINNLKEQTFSGLLEDLSGRISQLTRDTMIIIDPISKFDNYRAQTFYDTMRVRRDTLLEKGVSLSILVTMHADEKPKWKLISSEDIRGGDKTIQAFDSTFVLQEAREEGHRFINQLKGPKGTIKNQNVTLIKFSEENDYTHFEYVGEARPENVLPLEVKVSKEKFQPMKDGAIKPKAEDVEPKVHALIKAQKMGTQINHITGKKYTKAEIAKELGITEKTLYNWRQDESIQAKVKEILAEEHHGEDSE